MKTAAPKVSTIIHWLRITKRQWANPDFMGLPSGGPSTTQTASRAATVRLVLKDDAGLRTEERSVQIEPGQKLVVRW